MNVTGSGEAPVVDADGHVVEALPLVVEYMRRVAGDEVADRFTASSPAFSVRPAARLRPGESIAPWWALPATARDRATGFLPRLFHERLDEIGIDFAIVYSSVGLACYAQPDAAIRTGSCRALNTYLADMLDGLGDRMVAAAAIPTHTPDEAIAALDHAIGDLGFKAVMLNCLVPRAEGWFDTLALDSAYDYDPVWQRCVDLGVAVTVHSPTQGIPLRQSSSRYMYNHIGNFAASADAFAKALFFGGVLHRFPTLRVAFLECGVGWGVQLLCDLVGRWEKRGGANIERLDPSRVDAGEWDALVARYGGPGMDDPEVRRIMRVQSGNPPPELDDFRDSGVTGPADIVAQFGRLFFGCEADDPTTAWAYDGRVTPGGAHLNPVFGSDIGHWDVTDPTGVVAEAHELVDRGLLSDEQFRAFTCDNAIRLHASTNPAFFDGTRVEAYARQLLG